MPPIIDTDAFEPISSETSSRLDPSEMRQFDLSIDDNSTETMLLAHLCDMPIVEAR